MIRLIALVALLLVSPASAHAAPVAAVFTAVSAWIGSSLVVQQLLQLGLALGLSALQRAQQEKPAARGIKIEQTLTGDINPDGFIVGRSATSGAFVGPHRSFGDDNKYLVMVIDLGGVPGMALEGIFLSGERRKLRYDVPHAEFGIPVEQGGDISVRDGGLLDELGGSPEASEFKPLLWIKFYDGSQTSADGYLLNRFGDDPDYPWRPDMIGRGRAYAIVTARWHQDRQTSLPQLRFELKGIPLYDPRKDTSAGGAGGQRWIDRTTWRPSENPGVQVYNIMRGIPIGEDMYGGRIDPADLPLADFFAAMNEAELPIAEVGGSVPQYRSGLEILVDEPPVNAIREILRTCSGEIAETGGVWTIRIGAPTAPVHLISDGDIVVDRPQQLDPFPGLDQTINGLTTTYPDPETSWEPREAPPIVRSDLESTDDGRRLRGQLDLNACPYPVQVQRVSRSYVEDSRRFRSHVFHLPPDARHIRPLYSLSWTSDRNQYGGKLFELTERALDLKTYLVEVTLREVDPADYEWISDYELPVFTPTDERTVPVIARPAFAARGIAVPDSDGRDRRAAILIDADEADTSFDVEIVLAANDASVVFLHGVRLVPGHVVHGGILPAQLYKVRVRYAARGLKPTWANWQSVMTPDLRLSLVDIEGELARQIEATIADAEDQRDLQLIAFVTSEEARDEANLVAVDLAVVNTDLRGAIDGARDEIDAARAEVAGLDLSLTVLAQDLGAAVTTEAGARVDADSDIAVRIDTVEVTTGENTAAVTAETIARTEADGALAVRVETVEAVTGESAAAIEQEIIARTDADSALGAVIESINVSLGVAEDSLTVSDFTADSRFWSQDISGPPAGKGPLSPEWSFVDTADRGRIASLQLPVAVRRHVAPKAYVPLRQGRTYRISVMARHVGPFASGTPLFLRFWKLTGSFEFLSNNATIGLTFSAPDTWQVFTQDYAYSGALAPWLLPFAYVEAGYGTAANRIDIASLDITDITDRVAVEASVTTERTARVTADDAIATTASALATRVGTAESTITEQGQTITTQGATIATQRTDLNATIDEANAAFTSAASATAKADGITTLLTSTYLVRVKAGGAAGEVEFIAYDSEAGLGSTARLTFDNIFLDGDTLTNKLTVGLGRNLLEDSDFAQGTRYWSVTRDGAQGAETLLEYISPGQDFAGLAFPTLGLIQRGGASTGFAQAEAMGVNPETQQTTRGCVPCKAGDWLMASARPYAVGCSGELRILFRDVNLTFLASNTILIPNGGGAIEWRKNPRLWTSRFLKMKAPAEAAFAQILVRKITDPVNSGSSGVYWYQPQLEHVTAETTRPSPYGRSGVSIIDGGNGVFSGTLTADRVNVASFEAAGVSTFGGALKSANFNAGSQGWRITNSGDAEFNDVIIRRKLEVAAGSLSIGDFTPTETGSSPPTAFPTAETGWAKVGKTVFLDATSIAITAWRGTSKTYLAVAGMTGGINASNNSIPDVYWGWEASVLPLTRWSGNQTLRLMFDFWSRNVGSVEDCQILWKIYEVS